MTVVCDDYHKHQYLPFSHNLLLTNSIIKHRTKGHNTRVGWVGVGAVEKQMRRQERTGGNILILFSYKHLPPENQTTTMTYVTSHVATIVVTVFIRRPIVGRSRKCLRRS